MGPSGAAKLLGGNLTPADRHGSVQVVSSTNGDLANEDPTGHSNTPITGGVDQIDVLSSETKYVLLWVQRSMYMI